MIEWGKPNERYYQHGLDRGVLYISGLDPVPWNGLTGFTEAGTGGGTSILYRDGVIYLSDTDATDFEGSLTSIFFPDEFSECLGMPQVTDGMFVDNQKPKPFGMSYRSLVGSGMEGDFFGYQIHLVYNAIARIGDRQRKTLGQNVELTEFSFEIAATPVKLAGYRPSAHYILDTRFMGSSTVAALEAILYGEMADVVSEPLGEEMLSLVPGRLPTPTELFDLLNFGDAILVKDNGDGTITISGSNENVQLLTPSTALIKNINAVTNPDGTIVISDGGDTTIIPA